MPRHVSYRNVLDEVEKFPKYAHLFFPFLLFASFSVPENSLRKTFHCLARKDMQTFCDRRLLPMKKGE